MVVFNFNGITHDQCRRMVNEIRHGVYNYSLHKNNWVPYSLALALEIGGPRIVTGTVNPKVNITRISLSTILGIQYNCRFWALALSYIFWQGFQFYSRVKLHRYISVVDTVFSCLSPCFPSLFLNNMPLRQLFVILNVPTVSMPT